MEQIDYIAQEENTGIRLDKFLSDMLPEHSRSYIQTLIAEGSILVNQGKTKSNYKLKKDDTISVIIPEPVELDVVPEDIPLDIIYEDMDVVLVNKPKGMVVHPAAGHTTGTLVNALMYHCKDSLSTINGVMRPGIVHRIDMDTTGVLVVCKNDIAHQYLAEQLKVHSITRRYRAIVHGNLKQENGTIHTTIGRHHEDRKKMAVNVRNGRDAVTHYKVLQQLKGYTYIECELETGRTHQIRVHMASIGHPILGDMVYGPKKCPIKGLQGQTLHAMILGFDHPTRKEYVEFEVELPEYFKELLTKLCYN